MFFQYVWGFFLLDKWYRDLCFPPVAWRLWQDLQTTWVMTLQKGEDEAEFLLFIHFFFLAWFIKKKKKKSNCNLICQPTCPPTYGINQEWQRGGRHSLGWKKHLQKVWLLCRMGSIKGTVEVALPSPPCSSAHMLSSTHSSTCTESKTAELASYWTPRKSCKSLGDLKRHSDVTILLSAWAQRLQYIGCIFPVKGQQKRSKGNAGCTA